MDDVAIHVPVGGGNEDHNVDDGIWRSCCLYVDKHAMFFVVQVVVSMIIIIFSIYQLVYLEDCHSQQMYSSLLTLVVGVFLPSPRMGKIAV